MLRTRASLRFVAAVLAAAVLYIALAAAPARFGIAVTRAALGADLCGVIHGSDRAATPGGEPDHRDRDCSTCAFCATPQAASPPAVTPLALGTPQQSGPPPAAGLSPVAPRVVLANARAPPLSA